MYGRGWFSSSEKGEQTVRTSPRLAARDPGRNPVENMLTSRSRLLCRTQLVVSDEEIDRLQHCHIGSKEIP